MQETIHDELTKTYLIAYVNLFAWILEWHKIQVRAYKELYEGIS